MNLELPHSLIVLMRDAIRGCPQIDRVELPDGTTRIGLARFNYWGAFFRNGWDPFYDNGRDPFHVM